MRVFERFTPSVGLLLALVSAPASATTVNYTIAPSGGDYTSVRSAYIGITATPIAPNTNINFNVAAGSYTDTTTFTVQSRFGNIFTVKGATPITHSLSSIVSSSGSAGSYSVVLQLDDVTGITASQDYIIIGNASGGTNPTYMDGVFPVTAVDTGSNQITVTSLSQASSAPSGSVTATVTDIPTVLHWTGTSAIQIFGQSALALQNIVIVGDGTTGQWCVDDEDVSRLYLPGFVGMYNCGNGGMQVNFNSQVNSGTSVVIAASGGRDPVYAWAGGQIQIVGGSTLVAMGGTGSTGTTDANVRATQGGYVNVGTNGVASGGLADGMFADNASHIFAENSFSTGNAKWGYHTYRGSYIDTIGATASGNGTGSTSSSGFFDMTGIGVTCSGTPTASFATNNGIVTHC